MRRSYLALSLLIFANAVFAAGTRSGFDPVHAGPGWQEGRAMVLLPNRALTDADRVELAKEGIFVGRALSGGRYLARVTDGMVGDDSRIAALQPVTAEMKIGRSAWRETASGKTWAELNVIFHRGVPFDDARASLLAAGAALADPFATDYAPSRRVKVKIAPASLTALAADERVLTIAGPRRFRVQTDNAVSAAISHVTQLHDAPYDLTGINVTVSLFELAEAQASHAEFQGRLVAHATGGGGGDKIHATHVSGTIAAAGIRLDARGIAPKSFVHQFCVTCGQNDLQWLEIKENDLTSLGVIADNNSWGYILGWSGSGIPVWNDAAEYYGAYDLIVGAPLDEISIDKNILFIHSSGNDGDSPRFGAWFEHSHVDENGDTIIGQTFCYSADGTGSDCPTTCNGGCEKERHHDTLPFDTIGVTAAAKNIVTVGAVTELREIVDFSSRGPAKDGRVKPDLVARGAGVLSTIPTDSYGRLSGTSMAAPVVTGVAALLTEQWRRTFAGANPTPAQLKALLLAGADDLGNPGPDYTYGFGLVNAQNSADLIIDDGGAGKRIRNLRFPQGEATPRRLLLLHRNKGSFRVLLNWADPPIVYLGEPNPDVASKALVNDLDLRVVSGGETFLPYVLDKSSFDAPATTGVNTVDNVELVEIENAVPGLYHVVIGGRVFEGPQDVVVVTDAEFLPCSDLQERNDTAETAHGNLVSGQSVSGAICTEGDVDFFRFTATKTGPVSVTVTTGDTPMRVTMSGSGISRTQEVAANSTATLNADATTVPNQVTVKIEAIGPLGTEPHYVFTPQFEETNQPRRRSVRR